MKRLALVLLCLMALGAGILLVLDRQDKLAEHLNEQWPPVSPEQQRATAIESAGHALGRLGPINLAFGVSIDALEGALEIENLAELGITKLTLRGEEQLLRLDASFSHRFEGQESDLSEEAASLLQSLTPEVQGRVRVYAGVTSATPTEGGLSEIELRILPALEQISVDRVRLGGSADVSVLGKILVDLLNRYKGNVSGALAQLPAMKITLPTELQGAWDASQTIHAEGASMAVEARPVQAPVELAGVAWLISEEHITAAATLIPRGGAPLEASGDVPKGFSELEERFRDLFETRFGRVTWGADTWAAVRKDLLSYSLNDLLAQADLCVAGTAELEEQRIREKIAFPGEKSIDCTPTRDCTPKRRCDFKAKKDTRGCRKCLIKKPFGGCLVRGNDPFCEAAKAAQNVAYQAEAAAKKLDCERLKSQEKAACELEKAGEKALCETGKEFLKRLARTGKFANLDGSIQARTEGLRVCLSSFRLSEALDRVELTLDVSGSASADVHLKFVPLDIAGHLLCQAPWTERQRFTSHLQEPAVSLAAEMDLKTGGKNPRLEFQVEKRTLPLRLDPSPAEFLLNSPDIAISCQGLNLIRPLAMILTPFIPELQGEIDFELEDQKVALDLSPPTLELAGRSLTIAVEQSAESLLFFGLVKGASLPPRD